MQCERISQALNNNKITQESLGKGIGVSKATISQWESGTTEPNGKNLVSLAKAPGVTIEWLLEGEKNTEAKAPLANAKIIGNFTPWDSNTSLGEDEIEIPFFKEISLSAGKGIFVGLDNNGYKTS